ncbi:MAG: 2-oxo acid dehydrogenase subunit E2 [Candidatus Bathyarchaeota archaeon]|nr:2-oxo acid dehydrogenase subunit E2 [Candidatus Bathyarchaeota archaeon]MDH5494274.1 2-oxo acid dehydrogenase subunit E2 [Candidatus Bathyarchaeota archaeon]
MVTKILMPRLSLTMKTGSVIQWFKKEGETVEKGEPVVEVLSEKVTYDVEASTAGVLRKILAEEGVDMPVGATLALIAAPDEELPEVEVAIAAEAPPTKLVEKAAVRKETETTVVRERVLASPAAKRLAKERNIDLTQVQGTGPEGRIAEEDVKRFIEEKTELTPRVREVIPLTGIRRTTAERVASSFQTAPHSFIIMDVDMTEAVKLQEKTQSSYTAILVYAVAKALREHPTVNSTLIDGKIQVYEDINIGVAVSTDKGLVVPIIGNADKKQLAKTSSELEELAEKARRGKLSKEQLTGGTFTVTNLGMYGVKTFLPIINPPEAAILAAGCTVEKPVAAGKEIVVKPVMTLTLAYDHRIIDGAPASIFLRKIKEIIEARITTE